MRVYYKPFVDWIWGGCFIMALGGFIAATERALSRQGEAIGDGARRERGGGMKRLWFLIPLAAFFALAAILARGLKL